MSDASALLKALAAVIAAKADKDPDFAAEIVAAVSRLLESGPRRSPAPRSGTPASSLDLEAEYRSRGPQALQRHLESKTFTIPALKSLMIANGIGAPAGKALKSDYADALVRHLRRQFGEVDLGAA